MVMIKVYYMDMIIMMCGVGHCWYQSIDFLKGTDIFDKKMVGLYVENNAAASFLGCLGSETKMTNTKKSKYR